jgi:cell division protein FtsW
MLGLMGVFLLFGLMMVYSSTGIISYRRYGNETYFVLSHLLHILLGLGVGFFFAMVNLEWVKKITYPVLAISLVALLLPLIPGVGVHLGGASRWIQLSGLRLQPSEFAKIGFLFYLAYSLSKKKEANTLHRFSIGVVPHLGVGALFALLLLIQPDFGSTTLYTLLLFFMLFVAGIPFRYLLGLGSLALPAALGLVWFASYRKTRLLSFLSPWENPEGSGFQVLQALTAFSSGSWVGKGLGNSQGKLFFIPQAHSDFVFSVMGEEIGFLGILIFLVLWGTFIVRGFYVSSRCRKPYEQLIAAGAAFLLMSQSMVHIWVNLSLLPPKGMNLPFVSTGGSNLIYVLILSGLLVNCASRVQIHSPPLKDETER